jgi:hypothetical protein
MKKLKNQKTATKVAIVAGAAALMALTPQTQAQTSVDNLLNKLEQKGILTPNEADELKAENETNSVEDFNKAFNSKFAMPDWIKDYKLSGDFRGRFDDVSTEIPAFGGHDNNIRLRYRLRAGLVVDMQNDLQVGFRLISGDAPGAFGGNPLSGNSTMLGNASKKFVYVDQAYGKWAAINDGTWMVAGTIGKMSQPFQESYMLFDPDYSPEGAALQATYKINEENSLAFNGAGFVLDQVNTRGPFLYGGQAMWNANWTPALGTVAGIATYDIANDANFAASAAGTPYDSNRGNTITGAAAGDPFARHFNPIVGSASVTYTLDSFPLYTGKFPITAAGEFMDNPAAGSNNKGWWAGVSLGKAVKRGSWDISYRYQRLEADAWWDQIVDDDNIAATPTVPAVVPETGAAVGGTNIKGHLVKLDYAIFDSLTFSFTCYINDLINNPVPSASSSAVHAMADLMWKF